MLLLRNSFRLFSPPSALSVRMTQRGTAIKKQKKQEKAFEHILENGSKLYRTDVEGTITLTFSQNNAYDVSYTG